MFHENDIEQFNTIGIGVHEVESQIAMLRRGTQFVDLYAPATVHKGIIVVNDEFDNYVAHYNKWLPETDVLCFVPASGAASRMFKRIMETLGVPAGSENDFRTMMADTNFYSVGNTLSNINAFAFSRNLAGILGEKYPISVSHNNYQQLLHAMVGNQGLNYAKLPKGLILFHQYGHEVRTAFADHVCEILLYAVAGKNTPRLHFTVSPEHLDAFKILVGEINQNVGNRKIEISFSMQLPKTDTVAIDSEEQPFRNPDGSLLFRPGGHGALIENLQQLDADIIFIKNIDNIANEWLQPVCAIHKKLLGGLLLQVRDTIFNFLHKTENRLASDAELDGIYEYATATLGLDIAEIPDNAMEATRLFRKILNRPIRVCGMVKNTGEPGGGPFWVRNNIGQISLQIVEKAQVDMNNDAQAQIFSQSTHFNPVDLACITRNYKGEKFNLIDFRDNNTCFVAQKTHMGKPLSALELPGLWNGAMAHWITLFAEVPVETFNPVKEINDLLRSGHQPKQ